MMMQDWQRTYVALFLPLDPLCILLYTALGSLFSLEGGYCLLALAHTVDGKRETLGRKSCFIPCACARPAAWKICTVQQHRLLACSMLSIRNAIRLSVFEC